MKKHIISKVNNDSIAMEMGLEPGDAIVSINGNEIEDIFDYQYLCQDDYIEVKVLTKDNEECILEIDKYPDEDLGIEFENGLMDDYHSCRNKCIFCFIDQMPKGMRKALYFKDDDTRLSFLHGNYVTLTNLKDSDIDRLIKYRLEPINISFQTMNRELRCKMLNNRFAGEALDKVQRLYEAGITMNGQIVLCKGYNDGKELEYSLGELYKYHPVLQSLSVVPVGLTKYRDGLCELSPFNKEDAEAVIDVIEMYQNKAYKQTGMYFVHASDEWYILAGRELPKEERYDGYLQLENGVGMLTNLVNEVEDALMTHFPEYKGDIRNITAVTGALAFPTIEMLKDRVCSKYNNVNAVIKPIRNDFFGHNITVSGLITGQDIAAQLKGEELGEELLIPENMLRSGDEIFLDDMTVTDLQNALQVRVRIVKSSGMDFVKSLLGID